MRSIPWSLSAIVILSSLSLPAVGQVNSSTSGSRTPPRLRAPSFRGTADAGRNRSMGTLGNSRAGFTTRHDQMQWLIATTTPNRQATYNASRNTTPINPIDQILQSRNLLAARSPLAKKTVTRDPFGNLIEEESSGFVSMTTTPVAPASTTATPGGERPTTSEFLDTLSDRLKDKGDEYFEVGQAFFRNGDYVKAKSYFEMDREINRYKSRPYVADALTAGETRDINRAFTSIMLALRRAEQPSDILVNKADFYGGDNRLDRTVSLINVMVNQSPDLPAMHLLLAFYSWINGDTSTARSSASRAAALAPSPAAALDQDTIKQIEKFATLVHGEVAESPGGTLNDIGR